MNCPFRAQNTSKYCWRVLLLLASISGCAATRLPSIAYDVPGHYVVRLGPYAVTTDYPIDRKDPILQELLTLRDDVHRQLELPSNREIIRIVIFENQQRYDDFFRRNFPELPPRRALFVKQTDGQMAVFTFRGENLGEDLRHETTHALLHSSLAYVPLWLDEGIAEYFEVPPGDDGPPPHSAALVAYCSRGWEPDLDRLEELRDLWQMNAADYRECWLWVHFCLNHSDETRQILRTHLKETALVASVAKSASTDDGSKDAPTPIQLTLASRLSGIAVEPRPSVLAHLESVTAEMPEDLASTEAEDLPEPAHPKGRRSLSKLLAPWGN